MIEFHFDLDGSGEEYDGGHCWLPQDIEPMIKTILCGIEADGNGEIISMPVELNERQWRADPRDGLRTPLSKYAKVTSNNTKFIRNHL